MSKTENTHTRNVGRSLHAAYNEMKKCSASLEAELEQTKKENRFLKTKSKPSSPKPWKGNLYHAKKQGDDWGCIRDQDENCILRVQIQNYDKDVLNKHRKNKTDPTQPIIDHVLNKLN